MKSTTIALFFVLVILKFINAEECQWFSSAPDCGDTCPDGWEFKGPSGFSFEEPFGMKCKQNYCCRN